MVVEDEAIVAMDLENQLRSMGYAVIAQESRGEDAVARAVDVRPDLVLMDIRLAGAMDGIEAATRIRRAIDAPVVYLTAHSDDETFGRASVTDPVAYVLKPFDRRSLKAAIDLGLYRHRMDARLRQMERWLASTLRSMGDAVVTTDLEGRVTYLNQVAERVAGWPLSEAEGRPLERCCASPTPRARRCRTRCAACSKRGSFSASLPTPCWWRATAASSRCRIPPRRCATTKAG
jgi:CheY-like chemotaxis protein